jgi:hypothetical protein
MTMRLATFAAALAVAAIGRSGAFGTYAARCLRLGLGTGLPVVSACSRRVFARAIVAAALAVAVAAPAAGAQSAGTVTIEASPKECVAFGIAQGLSFEQALRACMLETGEGAGSAIGELMGPDTPAPAEATTCATGTSPIADKDGGYETVVHGHKDPPLRTLTPEERADLWEAAHAFPVKNEVAAWTDMNMGDVWDTAAKAARAHAKETGTKADKQRAKDLETFSVLVLAAREGLLARGPWTPQQVKGMAKLIQDGPTWDMVTGDKKLPASGDQCALTAAALAQLKVCDANAWSTPDCKRLQHCPPSEVTDPTPDGEIACGDPEIDTDALQEAARLKCQEQIHPAPGEDPCAGRQGALVIDLNGPAADACHDPAAQPLQDGCVKISLAPPGTVNIVQVIGTGLERLGGPIVVLPDDGPHNPHA